MMAYHKPNVTGYLFIPYNITGPTRVNWSPGIVRRPESSHRVRPLGCTAIGWPHGLSWRSRYVQERDGTPIHGNPQPSFFRGYKPYFYGLKPSFFVVLGSHGLFLWPGDGIFRPSILFDPGSGFLGWSKCERPAGFPVQTGGTWRSQLATSTISTILFERYSRTCNFYHNQEVLFGKKPY